LDTLRLVNSRSKVFIVDSSPVLKK